MWGMGPRPLPTPPLPQPLLEIRMPKLPDVETCPWTGEGPLGVGTGNWGRKDSETGMWNPKSPRTEGLFQLKTGKSGVKGSGIGVSKI